MSSSSDLLTVIVPTRERPDTLLHCLRTITEQKDKRLEIIVSDNCSPPETKAVVDSFNDSRLRYIRPEKRLGMSEHWEFALSHASGSWVAIIGDDDGLLPNAVENLFELIKNTNTKAISTCPIFFSWPEPQDIYSSGKLIYHKYKSKTELRDSRYWLKKVLETGMDYVTLPCLYTGSFVHIDVINEIKKRSGGEFFKSITPDAYSGIAVTSLLKNYIYSYTPLAVQGSSHHSNGKKFSTIDAKNMNNLPFFKENGKKFNPLLGNGFVRSVPIITYEAYLQCAHLRNFDLKISMERQLGLTILYCIKKEEIEEVTEYCKKVAELNGINFKNVLKEANKMRIQKKLARVANNIGRTFSNKKIKYSDIKLRTVYDAAKWLGDNL